MQEAWEDENFKARRRYQRWEEMRTRFSPEDTALYLNQESIGDG